MNSLTILRKGSVFSLMAALLLPPEASAQALRRQGQFPPPDSVLTANDAKVQEGRQRLQACVAQVQAGINRENRESQAKGGSPLPSARKSVVIGAAVTIAGAALIVYAWPIAVAIGAKATVSAIIGSGGIITFVGVASVASGVNELNSRAAKFSVCKGIQFKADARNAIQPQ